MSVTMTEIEIKINEERLTFGVLRRLENIKTFSEAADVLNEIIEGGVDDLPVTVLPSIVQKVKELLTVSNSLPNSGGG
jgi:hypothetical protein